MGVSKRWSGPEFTGTRRTLGRELGYVQKICDHENQAGLPVYTVSGTWQRLQRKLKLRSFEITNSLRHS